MRPNSLDLIGTLILAIICLTASQPSANCRQSDATAVCGSFAEPVSPIQTINSFTVRDWTKKSEKRLTVQNATVVVSLLTPLNSGFNKEGDVVQAEVVQSDLKGAAWLPHGTILTGCIERADRSTYCRTDAKLYIRFYEGNADGKAFELNSAPTTADSAVHPEKVKLTTKGKVRSVLMCASFIAIPMAVGSLGTSLAITTGAGAVVGGVLADDGKHIEGAISGAWEGSGLGVLDPVVRKGQKVILPVGTKIALQLRQPAQIPVTVIKMARNQQAQDAGEKPTVVGLSTNVKILKPVDAQAVAQQCDVLLSQHDLASALALLDRTLESAPDDKVLVQMRQHLYEQISGGTSSTNSGPNL